jgi:hypothetical protein
LGGDGNAFGWFNSYLNRSNERKQFIPHMIKAEQFKACSHQRQPDRGRSRGWHGQDTMLTAQGDAARIGGRKMIVCG